MGNLNRNCGWPSCYCREGGCAAEPPQPGHTLAARAPVESKPFNRPSETAAILTDALMTLLTRADALNIEEKKALTVKLESTSLDPSRLIQVKELLGL